jgi:hypothetical protein
MQYTTRFSIGDEVWVIWKRRCERKVLCTTCSNTGKVMVSGEEFQCPKCHGACLTLQYAGEKWVIETFGVVGQITIVNTTVDYVDDKLTIQYMIDTTGVGSGTCWLEKNTYESRAAAQAECDKRNASTNWEDDKLS